MENESPHRKNSASGTSSSAPPGGQWCGVTFQVKSRTVGQCEGSSAPGNHALVASIEDVLGLRVPFARLHAYFCKGRKHFVGLADWSCQLPMELHLAALWSRCCWQPHWCLRGFCGSFVHASSSVPCLAYEIRGLASVVVPP
jgi:hypothetical protein